MTDNLHCATVSVRGVIFRPDDQLLLLQRPSDRQWELPGGRLASGEHPMAGLDREIGEETGLSVTIDALCCADSWTNDAGHDRFAVCYACRSASTAVTLSDEHVSARWVSPREATTLLSGHQHAAVAVAITQTPQPISMPETASLSSE